MSGEPFFFDWPAGWPTRGQGVVHELATRPIDGPGGTNGQVFATWRWSIIDADRLRSFPCVARM